MPMTETHAELKQYLLDLYKTLRKEQGIEDLFYHDRYDVPQLGDKSIIQVQYTGKAARLIDSPLENIITSNPQAYRIPAKETKGAEEANIRVMGEINEIWIPYIKQNTPNLFKESVRKVLLRGDVWGRVWHNEKWDAYNVGLPIVFGIPDPMTVYADPTEECNGVPSEVMVHYYRNPASVIGKYPHWTNPKNAVGATREGKAGAEWVEIWDKKTRTFYADDEMVLQSDNPYGFVPFVHKLAGFGTTSPEGKLEELIVGRLRYARSTIQRFTALISAIDWTMYDFANKSFDAQVTVPNVDVPEDFEENYRIGLGQMHRIPYGVEVTKAVTDLPGAEVFGYINSINRELELEDPLILQGQPVGESGRQQDMTQVSALRRYDTVIENIEVLWGQMFGMGLQLMDKMGWLRPETIRRGDIGDNYDVQMRLKAADPLENDRKAVLGSRLLAQGEIDPITNLVEFKGYTEEKARKILVDRLKWNVLLNDPMIAQVIGYRAVEHAGMAEDLEIVKQRAAMLDQQNKQGGLQEPPTPTEAQRQSGEVQPGTGMQMIDMALTQRAQRKPPVDYTRS